MGCDIHYVFEKRGPSGVYEPIWPLDAGEEGWFYYPPESRGIFDVGRCYWLFALLAGVRNYFDAVPIAEPRGVPLDASGLYRAMAQSDGPDAHSHSWVTLEELLRADYDQRLEVVTVNGPKVWSLRGLMPPTWFDLLQALEEHGDPRDVRMVFHFDS